MYRTNEWVEQSLNILEKRAISVSDFYTGKLILVRKGDKNDNYQIDLINGNGYRFETEMENIFSYEKLKNSQTVEARLALLRDAVREFNFHFYVDNKIVDYIKYGIEENDCDED